MITEKVCPKCGLTKAVADFNTWVDRKSGKTRIKSYCRECNSITATTWKKRNRARTADIQKRYEIRHADQIRAGRERRRLLQIARAGGKCQNCGEWNPELLSVLSSGKVLCQNCRKLV